MFKISKTSHQMYLPSQCETEVKPTKFEKHLAASTQALPDRKLETQLLNKATLMGSGAYDSFNFLMKSLWVHSAGKRHHKLRDLVQSKQQ